MAGLRDLVTGSEACAPSGGLSAGPSNAMSSLVNKLLGTATKSQEHFRDLPHLNQGSSSGINAPPLLPDAAIAHASSFHAFPGTSSFQPPPNLLQGVLGGPLIHQANQEEWDSIYRGESAALSHDRPLLIQQGPHQQAVASMLQAFIGSSRVNGLAPPLPLDPSIAGNLSLVDKCRIRDRATILSRQMHNAELGPMFADEQVSKLLASLRIDPMSLPGELPHVHDSSWHGVWDENKHQMGSIGAETAMNAAYAQGLHQRQMEEAWTMQSQQRQQQNNQRHPSTGWASEFVGAQTQPPQPLKNGQTWTDEFSAMSLTSQKDESKWTEEFVAQQESSSRVQNGQSLSSMQSTRAMVDQLSRDPDPKMRSSKFLQFISKLSHGEISFQDNKVVENKNISRNAAEAFKSGAQWADEFSSSSGAIGNTGDGLLHSWQQEHPPHQPLQGLRGDWANEFAHGFVSPEGGLMGSDSELEAAWRQHQPGLTGDPSSWADELKMEEGVYNEWEKIYGMGQVDASIFGEPVHAASARRGEYVFAKENPFLGDSSALEKGRDLFRRGLLTEAALAVEAEVVKSPMNADAWQLLGTIHAENDDDQQAIAAMERALQADPNHLNVLLSLGVSHTNELDTDQAVSYLNRWLRMHPQYGEVATRMGEAPDDSQLLSHAVRTFEVASSSHPESDELNVALGVLYHLGRSFGPAVEAFERALQLRPNDYSLWNKLGATLANNSRSSEALNAYQKALDLKPNYMRAWTNMGISFSNLGEYDRSARFYIRALALNPNASQVWGYLRTALACEGRFDLVKEVDDGNLALLTQQLPLK